MSLCMQRDHIPPYIHLISVCEWCCAVGGGYGSTEKLGVGSTRVRAFADRRMESCCESVTDAVNAVLVAEENRINAKGSKIRTVQALKHTKDLIQRNRAVYPMASTHPGLFSTDTSVLEESVLFLLQDLENVLDRRLVSLTSSGEPAKPSRAPASNPVEKPPSTSASDHPAPRHEAQRMQAYIKQQCLEQPSTQCGWDSIAGLGQAKKALFESLVLPMTLPSLFDNSLLSTMKTATILLHGPPGVGVSCPVFHCSNDSHMCTCRKQRWLERQQEGTRPIHCSLLTILS